MPGVDKKVIQDFWTKNVPGHDIERASAAMNSDFFNYLDLYRLKNEPYVVPLIEYLSQKKGRILEVGCGLGADSRNFAKRDMNVVSADLSFHNVASTKKGFRYAALDARFVNLDAEKLPFKDESFDAYYSFGVLHHTPDTAKAIDEAHRVLKKGGRCVIMLYHKGYAYIYIHARYGLRRLFVSEERLLSDHYDSTPLSQMFSKKDASKLFSKFAKIDFEVTTFAYGGVDVARPLRPLHRMLKNKFLMDKLGQFLVIKAQK